MNATTDTFNIRASYWGSSKPHEKEAVGLADAVEQYNAIRQRKGVRRVIVSHSMAGIILDSSNPV